MVTEQGGVPNLPFSINISRHSPFNTTIQEHLKKRRSETAGSTPLKWCGSIRWMQNIVHYTLYLIACKGWVVRRVFFGNGVPITMHDSHMTTVMAKIVERASERARRASEASAAVGEPRIKLCEPWSQLGGPQSQLGGPLSKL